MSKAQHFEAIKYSLRQSKDGVVVAFVVQPEDVRPELMALPVGARVMIAWSQIGDDERQIGGGERPTPHSGEVVAKREPAAIAAPEPKDRRPFHTLPLAQQAGIRANDEEFFRFLIRCHPSVYADASAGADEAGAGPQEVAAECVRRLCGVQSRQQLATDHDAANIWRALEAEYQRHHTDTKYADSRHG